MKETGKKKWDIKQGYYCKGISPVTGPVTEKKKRTCLKCDNKFESINGRRLCERCNRENGNYLWN